MTICSAAKRHYFGEITIAEPEPVRTRFIASTHASTPAPQFIPSPLGHIIEESIPKIPSHYNDVEIWNYVVMPNHIHMIIAIHSQPVGTRPTAPSGCLKQRRHEAPESQDFHHNTRLASIVGAFKAGVTRLARTRKIASLQADENIWQPRYHEHIIRDQHAYDNIMNYIDTNVENWNRDCFNRDAVRTRFIASAPTSETGASTANTQINADAMNRVPTANNHEA